MFSACAEERGRTRSGGMARFAVRCAAFVAATALGGCYDYVAMPGGGVPAGGDVQATLTDAGSLLMAASIGPRVASLEGRLDESRPDSLVMRVRKLTHMDGTDNGWGDERVAIPLSAVASVRERQLNRGRTALGIAAGVGATIAVLVAQHNRGSDVPPVGTIYPPTGQYRGVRAP